MTGDAGRYGIRTKYMSPDRQFTRALERARARKRARRQGGVIVFPSSNGGNAHGG